MQLAGLWFLLAFSKRVESTVSSSFFRGIIIAIGVGWTCDGEGSADDTIKHSH
jgi:hypothetical protein